MLFVLIQVFRELVPTLLIRGVNKHNHDKVFSNCTQTTLLYDNETGLKTNEDIHHLLKSDCDWLSTLQGVFQKSQI